MSGDGAPFGPEAPAATDRAGRAGGPFETTTGSVVVVAPSADGRAAVDVLLGLGAAATMLGWRASLPLRQVTGVVVAAASAVVPAAITSALADRGREARDALDAATRRVLQLVVPRVVGSVLATLDLNALVRKHVDLDGLAAELDVAAVINRVDLNAVVRRVDLDAVINSVDLDAVVNRVDLDAVVSRVDLNAVVDRVDLDAVAGKLDLDAVTARLDLDGLVERVDVEAVLARIDLAGIAKEVIAAVDLPLIVRESSGTLASEGIRGVRAGGIHADDAVARFVDRLLRRRSGPAASAAP